MNDEFDSMAEGRILAARDLNMHWQKTYRANDKPNYEFDEGVLNPSTNRKLFTVKLSFMKLQVTGSGTTKKEAQNMAAENMLRTLNLIPTTEETKSSNPLALTPTNQSTQSPRQSPVTTLTPTVEKRKPLAKSFEDMQLELNEYLDKYMPKRERNVQTFMKEFVSGLERKEHHFKDLNVGLKGPRAPKSDTLRKIINSGSPVGEIVNVIEAFWAIMGQMKWKYLCEFTETMHNDRYHLLIRVSHDLLTFLGEGFTPETAIRDACTRAIQYLVYFVQ